MFSFIKLTIKRLYVSLRLYLPKDNYMNEVLEDIEREGFDAAERGLQISDCDYPIGDIRRDSWIIGWGDYYYQ